MVHKTIFEELCRGQFLEKTRANYLRVMQQMAEAGAEGIVLGCTEIPLLVRSEDAPLPLFDTTRIHALVGRGNGFGSDLRSGLSRDPHLTRPPNPCMPPAGGTT